MRARPQRQEKIIKFLSTNKNGTFEVMFRALKMGRGALAMGLKELLDEDVIKKNEKKEYSIQTTPTKNKKIKLLNDNKIMNYDLDRVMKELKDVKEPFVMGYALLRTAMFALPKYTLELHSTRLTDTEKKECKEFINRCNQTIRRTFE